MLIFLEDGRSNEAGLPHIYVKHSSYTDAISTCLPTNALRFLSLWPVQHVASRLQIDSTNPHVGAVTRFMTTGLLLSQLHFSHFPCLK